MNSKERVYAVLEGKQVDRFPVTVLYNFLYYRDHFTELTGRPSQEFTVWQHAQPEEYLKTYRLMVEKAPFEILQPNEAPSRQKRDNFNPAAENVPTPAQTESKHVANETQYVFNKKDIDERIKINKAENLIASGLNDYRESVVAAFGKDHFILSKGVIGTLYSCSAHVGLTNLFSMLIEKPDIIEYLSKKILEQNIEKIRQAAAVGGDAIFIDDAMTTCDMISVEHYERFSLPYMKEMVREIHNLGHKAILIYFGGIADRLEQIASIGADGLSAEASMKGYTNDISEIARKIGDRITPFGNIDPVGMLQNGSDEELEAEIQRQAEAGRHARGFIMCTGSPITPATQLERVQRFIKLGHKQMGKN